MLFNWETISPFVTYVFIPLYIATGALCYKHCYICKKYNTDESSEDSNHSRPIEIHNVFELKRYSNSDDDKYEFYKKYSQESESEYNLSEEWSYDESSEGSVPLSTIWEDENESA